MPGIGNPFELDGSCLLFGCCQSMGWQFHALAFGMVVPIPQLACVLEIVGKTQRKFHKEPKQNAQID